MLHPERDSAYLASIPLWSALLKRRRFFSPPDWQCVRACCEHAERWPILPLNTVRTLNFGGCFVGGGSPRGASKDRLVGHGFVGVSGNRPRQQSVLVGVHGQSNPAVVRFSVDQEFDPEEAIL